MVFYFQNLTRTKHIMHLNNNDCNRPSAIHDVLAITFEKLSRTGITAGSISVTAILISAQFVAKAQSLSAKKGRDRLVNIMSEISLEGLESISYDPIAKTLPHSEGVMNRICDSIIGSLSTLGDGGYYPISVSSVLTQLSIQLFSAYHDIPLVEANEKLIEYLKVVPIELMESISIEEAFSLS